MIHYRTAETLILRQFAHTLFKELSMRTLLNTVGFIIILVFLITFAAENGQPANLTYYGMNFSCALYLLVVIPFFVGVACGNILDVVKRFQLKKEIKRLRNVLVKLDQIQYK
jgi:uncharacterized integral membrane protein